MSRRTFLTAVLGAAAVPSSIAKPALPILWGDGVHDDTTAIQAVVNGKPIHDPNGFTRRLRPGEVDISRGHFVLSSTLLIPIEMRIIFRDAFFSLRGASPMWALVEQEG